MDIYDKEALREGLAKIESMTVGEIRKNLPDGYAFLIWDSDWAILTREEIQRGELNVIV